MAGYTQSYVNDFTGTTLPAGWGAYSGKPGGDPGSQWGAAHVVVSNGMLQLETYQDSAYGGEWVTGGVSQYGESQTYGAYYVRSRVTGPGPTNVELLWPVAPVWPPEIDFNETGGATIGTSATVHWAPGNQQEQHSDHTVDMTQWHTWGVIWTPTSITYTVDGVAFGTVTNPSEIPNQAMTLDLQQQTWCNSGYACPTSPQSMDILDKPAGRVHEGLRGRARRVAEFDPSSLIVEHHVRRRHPGRFERHTRFATKEPTFHQLGERPHA